MAQQGYTSNEGATMTQWNAQNETVRKGQKGNASLLKPEHGKQRRFYATVNS